MAAAAMCVYCRVHEVDPRYRPFCSERCRLLDLAAWVDGKYRIPDGDAAPVGHAGRGAAARAGDDDALEDE